MEDITEENPDIAEQEAVLADDAVPVCPNCLEPCSPLDNYCSNCGSNEIINPLASYLPFVDLRFRIGMIGKLWQKICDKKNTLGFRVLYVFLFIVFMPLMFLMLMTVVGCQHCCRKK